MRSSKVLQLLHSLAVYLRAGRNFLYLQLIQTTTDATFLLQVVFQDLPKIKRLLSFTDRNALLWICLLKQRLLCLLDPPDIITKPTRFRESTFPWKRKLKEAKSLIYNSLGSWLYFKHEHVSYLSQSNKTTLSYSFIFILPQERQVKICDLTKSKAFRRATGACEMQNTSIKNYAEN